uniref:Uncharacterized protein n=1 Tax=Vespula pensylvanica TaxID=30213 RepID=A0A834KTV3_VESPE|nr:hypothetical protein H0235_012629 [Vespula pensylvanica]
MITPTSLHGLRIVCSTLLKITLGASVPVRSNKRGSVVFSSGFQYNYFLPSNVSNFKSTIVVARHVRDLDLRDTYSTIENLLEDSSLVEKQGKQTRSSLAFDVTGETSIGSRKDQRSQRSKRALRVKKVSEMFGTTTTVKANEVTRDGTSWQNGLSKLLSIVEKSVRRSICLFKRIAHTFLSLTDDHIAVQNGNNLDQLEYLCIF